MKGVMFRFGPVGWELPWDLRGKDVQWEGEGTVEMQAWCLGMRLQLGSWVCVCGGGNGANT